MSVSKLDVPKWESLRHLNFFVILTLTFFTLLIFFHTVTGLLYDMTNSGYGWDVSIQRRVSKLCEWD